MQSAYPVNNQQARGYYDKPADRRLRPWSFLGSLILTVCFHITHFFLPLPLMGLAMIITSTVHYGTLASLWGIFAAGVALTLAGLVGMIASLTLRPVLAALFFFTVLVMWIASLVVLIINAANLRSNTNGQCEYNGFSRYSQGCEDVREYHFVVYSVFGILTALWVPTIILAAWYLWRTTTLYRRQEYNANSTLPTAPTV